LTPSELAKCMYTAHWVRYFAPMGAWDISTKSFGPNEGEENLTKILLKILYTQQIREVTEN